MQLMNGYILVRVDDEVTTTKSGLLLNEGSVKLPSTGTIEQIADGVDELAVGDKIQFLRYASVDGLEKNTRLVTKDLVIAKL